MRILYQCTGFLPNAIGGAEVLSYHLVKELARRRHEILVITNRGESDPPGRQTFDGIDLIRLDFGPPLGSRNLSAARDVNEAVAETIKVFQPDLLHLNDAWLNAFFFLRGRATGNLPRVLTLHSPIRPAGRDGLQARLVADADRVVSISRANHAALVAIAPALRGKTSIIPNALPAPGLSPTDLPFAPALLLCVGRMIFDKGFDLALRAFARLLQRWVTAKLQMVGDGPHRSALESLARDLGVSGDVEFTGWVAPDRVPSLINTATIMLMPSRWPEPFGLVALQAAQMGRPLIASAVGGLPEIVEDGQTGLLVAPEDERSLEDAIERLLADEAMARRLGENARRRAHEKFDFPTLVDTYERVYAQALERRPLHGMQR